MIVGGLPASGKSTLAAAIGAARGWLTIGADAVRKEITGVGANPAPAAFGEGIYSAAHTEETYRTLLARADVALRHGESVVLDASFIDVRWRVDAAALAAKTHSRFVAVRCDAPRNVRERRLRARPHDAQQLSDATTEIAVRMTAHEDPWSAATPIDTTMSVDDCARDTDAAIEQAKERE